MNKTILKSVFFSILSVDGDKVLAIDCVKRNMPKWYPASDLEEYKTCTEQELLETTDTEIFDIDTLDSAAKKTIMDSLQHFRS